MTDKSKRNTHLLYARFAEETGRFGDMAQSMKQVVELDAKLNESERKSLAVAYRKAVAGQRYAWRAISTFLEKGNDATERQLEMTKELLNKIERDVEEKCREIVDLLDRLLLKEAANDEAKVFYLKLKADHFRYLAETRAENTDVVEKSKQAYQEAFDMAKDKLSPLHPTRLTVALNFAILLFEVQNLPAEACQLATQAYEDAFNEKKSKPEAACPDSVTIMELLQDNLEYWGTAAD
ncbi:hypothetical protein niasHT_000779 [Heterodera trifolii]|uniref:14-3-3 domain-containing protein n=1 Tax=Heterodera trifolii TaxID=157864 RepID=A0ABD2LN92_9BILA